MPLATRRLAEARLAWPGKTEAAALPDVYGSSVPYYRMEVRSAAGALLSTIPEWTRAEITERVNEAPEFRLTTRATYAAAFLEAPNQVWLYRSDSTTPKYKCAIHRTVDTATAGVERSITAWGLQRKLSDEMVDSYYTGDAGKTVRQILVDLLAFQGLSPTIRLGFIASQYGSETRILRVEYKSIGQAIDELRKQLGGYVSVGADNRLTWRATIGNNLGHVVRIGRNATSVRRDTDYSDVITRVIALGAGVSDDTRLKVTVNDSTAQSTYGVRVGYLNDQSIVDEGALTAAAEAALSKWKQPKIVYDVDMLDLSRTDLYDFTFDASLLDLGTRLNLLADDLGLDIWTRVVSVTRDIGNPLDVRVTVGNPDALGADGGIDTDTAEVATVEQWWESVERRLQRVEGDTGVLSSVASAIGADLSSVAHWDADEDVGNLPEMLEDVLGSNAPDAVSYQESLDDYLETVLGQTLPLPTVASPANDAGLAITSAAGTVGTDLAYAREDHTHQGMPWKTADTKANLSAVLNEGEIGHTTGTTKRGYVKIDGTVISFTHLEVS